MTAKFETWLAKAGLEKKQYQVDGVDFCLRNETGSPCHGGLIADEMGLGKTYIVLGTIISNFKRHTLIVLPLALLDQWVKIIEKTCGHTPLVWHGSKKKNKGLEELKNAPIVITTYGQISLLKPQEKPTDKPVIDNLLYQVDWDRVVFDEAHHLRNHGTSRFNGALKIRAPIRWLITGTPIQNKISDFYALCEQMGLEREFYSKGCNIRYIARNYMIKRTKAGVGIILPPVKTCEFEGEWQNSHEQEISEQIHSLLSFANVKNKAVSGSVNMLGGSGGSVLPYILRARQACIYPALLKKPLEKFMKEGLLDADSELLRGCDYNSKIDAVVDKIISRKDNKRGKIVFCHFRGEIDIIADKLKAKDIDVKTFDGRTSHGQRAAILEGTCDVLILQIQTGCEGLNLQQFKEIYFVSPHWNPAVEDQAVARCHRVGQDSEVEVFRFEMVGFGVLTKTIEKHCKNVQGCKREVAKDLDEGVEKAQAEECEPMTYAEKAEAIEGSVECMICHDVLAPKDSRRKRIGCGHTFCRGCINKWLEKSNTCPCCRNEVSNE